MTSMDEMFAQARKRAKEKDKTEKIGAASIPTPKESRKTAPQPAKQAGGPMDAMFAQARTRAREMDSTAKIGAAAEQTATVAPKNTSGGFQRSTKMGKLPKVRWTEAQAQQKEYERLAGLDVAAVQKEIGALDREWKQLQSRLVDPEVNYGGDISALREDRAREKTLETQIAQLQGDTRMAQDIARWQDYQALRQAPDFGEKSLYAPEGVTPKYQSQWMGTVLDTGVNDLLFDYVNGNEDAQKMQDSLDAARGQIHTNWKDQAPETVELFNYIYRTQGREAAYEFMDLAAGKEFTKRQAAAMGVAQGMGLTSALGAITGVAGKLTGTEEAARESYGQMLQDAATASQQHPVAYGLGNVGGSLALSLAAASGLGAVPGYATLPTAARSAIGGMTGMGGARAVQELGSVATGYESWGDYAANVLTSGIAGGVGGLAAAGAGTAGAAVLNRFGLQNNGLAKLAVAGVTGAAGGAGRSGTSQGLQYLRDPESYQFDPTTVATEALTGAAFSALNYIANAYLTKPAQASEIDPSAAKAKELFDGLSEQEAVAKYRYLAKEYHPDYHPGDAAAEAEMKAINGAWEWYKNNVMGQQASKGAAAYQAAQAAAKAGDMVGYNTAKADFDRSVTALAALAGEGPAPDGMELEALQILQAVSGAGITGKTKLPISSAAVPDIQETAPEAGELPEISLSELPEAAKKAVKADRESYTVVKRLRENIPEIADMEPVASVSTQEVRHTENGQTMAGVARALFDKIKGSVLRKGFGVVEIAQRSVKDDLSHGIGPAKAAVIPSIPAVIQNGRQIDFQERWKGRGYDGYVFAAPVTMDGDIVYVAAVVKKSSKNSFYLHEVVDSNGNIIKINSEEGTTQTSLAAESGAGVPTSLSDDSISQGMMIVNGKETAVPVERVRSVQEPPSDGRASLAGAFDTVAVPGPSVTRVSQQSAEVKPPEGTSFPSPDGLIENDMAPAGPERIDGYGKEAAGAAVSDGDTGRVLGVGTGEQAGGVAEGAGGGARPAEQGRTAVERQNRGKLLRWEKVSSASLKIKGGTEELSMTMIPEKDWDEGLRATARRVQEETGITPTFVLGRIGIKTGSGIRRARGAYSPGNIVIQADHMRLTTDQIADHEIFHDKASQTPGLIRELEDRIVARYGAEEFDRVVEIYVQKLRGVIDIPENAGPDEIDQAYLAVKEEIMADAYAGINAFAAHAERYREDVETVLEEKGIGRSRTAARAMDRTTGPPEEYSINESFAEEVEDWYRNGRPEGERFTLGSTGPVLQGLGAIEQDIYMEGDKISEILQDHPEMSLEEIKRIPEMLEDPVLILKSRGSRRRGQNTRLVLFGSIKAQNGQPIMVVLDLRPVEGHLVIQDMQKVNSAYTRSNALNYVKGSAILHADKKRTAPLLRTIGLHGPIELQQSGSMGSISYKGQNVNIEGVPFFEVIRQQTAAADGESGPPASGSAKMSIEYDATNTPYVVIEDDILSGVPRSRWVKTVKDNLRTKFPDGVTVGRNVISIDKQSRLEMTFSKYMQRLMRTDRAMFADKLRATNNADEILQAAQNWVNEALAHPRKDAIIDFARGEVLLRIGGNDYTAQVIVGNKGNGDLLLYDIINLAPTSIQESAKKVGAAYTGIAQKERHGRQATPTDNSIPETSGNVNGNFSMELPVEETKDLVALSLEQRTKLMSRMFSGATDKQLGLAIQKLSPEATQAVIAEGLQTGSGSDSFYQAKRLQQKLASGEAITPSELGRLYRANEDTRIGPNSQRARQEIAAREQSAEVKPRLQGETLSLQRDRKERRMEPTGKYWRPRLKPGEWELLNYKMETSGEQLDKATYWVYAKEKGTAVFAVYGIGDGTENTPLYALGGEKAVWAGEAMQRYVEGFHHETDRDGTALDRRIEAVWSKHRHGSGYFPDAENRGKHAGDVPLHLATQGRDGRGAAGRGPGDQGKAGRGAAGRSGSGGLEVQRYEPAEGQEIHLRDGGQRPDGTDPAGPVRGVEGGAGQDQSGAIERRPADGGAASLSYGGQVTTASLGIGGGSTSDGIRLVTGGDTAATASARAIAKERGMRLVLFGGGNLSIARGDGMVASVRGYVSGDRVFIRADHPEYTAEQIMRHEAGHDMIAKGEVDPRKVRERINKELGDGKTEQLAGLYEAAYRETDLSADEIWEEVICDSLGDMNIFSGTVYESEAREFLEETRKATGGAMEVKRNKGPPTAAEEGKASIERLPDGRLYVKADRQVIFGSDPDSWREQLENYINGKIRRGENVSLIAADGDVLILTGDTAGKVASPYTSKGTTLPTEEYYLKVNAGAHIDELVQVSQPDRVKRDVGGRHGDFASGGWQYRIAYFQDFDGEYYLVHLSAAIGPDGKVVYNIGQMQERSLPTVDGSSAESGALNGGKASPADSIPETGGNVNGNFSMELPVEETKDLVALSLDQRTKLMSRMFSGATDKQLGLAIQKLSEEATRAVIAEGLQTGSGSDSFYQAKRLQQKLASGETITPSELGRLYRANEDTRIGPNSQRARQEIAAREQGEPLALDEERALLDYKSSESYKINEALRDGRPLDRRQYRMVNDLDAALKKLPVFRGQVYRRMDFGLLGPEARETFLAEHQLGSFVQYPAYTSSSISEDGYKMAGEDLVTLVIQSETGRDLEGHGNNFENEVLFPRESWFLVERAETDAEGRSVIYMKEVTEDGIERLSGQLYSEEQHGGVQPMQEVSPGDGHLRKIPEAHPERETGGAVPGLRGERDGGLTGQAPQAMEKDFPTLSLDQRTKLMSRMFSGATDKQLGLAIQKLSPEATQAVIAEGLQTGSGSDSFYQAKRLQQKLASGETITPSELGLLYRANEDTRIGPNSRRARQEIAAREQVLPSGRKESRISSVAGTIRQNRGGICRRNLKRPKLSAQEWRQVQSAQMQKYAGMDEVDIPSIGYVFAHNRFYVIRNYGIGAFEVTMRLDPAKQQNRINIYMEEFEYGSDGSLGETTGATDA